MSELSHFDPSGASHMIDVSGKAESARLARASAQICMQPDTAQRIQDRELAKGDVLEVARLAGIMAAKRTGELIPLCHPLSLTAADLRFDWLTSTQLQLQATIQTYGRTGVEMEALTAVSIAALTVYDMCKAIDREMRIVQIQLEEKQGGKSGHYQREAN